MSWSICFGLTVEVKDVCYSTQGSNWSTYIKTEAKRQPA